jgi:hypothetical protein
MCKLAAKRRHGACELHSDLYRFSDQTVADKPCTQLGFHSVN